MKVYFENQRIPIKSWCNSPDENAIEQAKNLANLPFAFSHIVLLPDTHQGYGMPIGGVLAANNVIIPNAVGVDIGCGMLAIKTSITNIDKNILNNIVNDIKNKIPVGFKKHNQSQKLDNILPIKDNCPIIEKEFSNADKSLGTLGGGNHFIEIQKDENDYVWIMIHSGSRNLGKQVADFYNDEAKKLNEQWYSNIDASYDLAFLPFHSNIGKQYFREMNYCLEYAYQNRLKMINDIKNIFTSYFDCCFNEQINIHHNYARLENHFGKNVLVHRKGATSAKKGELGIIPGSQGTHSYIVKGKGNKESFMSCSHGAGRKISRKKAKQELNLEEQQKILNDQNIIHSIKNNDDLDEAPGAYKNINVVMDEQKELVDIVARLKPIAVIKG